MAHHIADCTAVDYKRVEQYTGEVQLGLPATAKPHLPLLNWLIKIGEIPSWVFFLKVPRLPLCAILRMKGLIYKGLQGWVGGARVGNRAALYLPPPSQTNLWAGYMHEALPICLPSYARKANIYRQYFDESIEQPPYPSSPSWSFENVENPHAQVNQAHIHATVRKVPCRLTASF